MAVFLESDLEPTIAVLCEPMGIIGGRPAIRAASVKLATFGLGLQSLAGDSAMSARAACPLWTVDGLPNNCTSLLPVPAPVGGVLIISDHALLWATHASTFGVGFSSDAVCAPIVLRTTTDRNRLTLRGASAAVLSASPLRVCLSLGNGELYIAALQADGRGVTGARLLKAAASVPASCACSLEGGRFLFLGSAVADSMLLQLGGGAAPPQPRRVGMTAHGGAAAKGAAGVDSVVAAVGTHRVYSY